MKVCVQGLWHLGTVTAACLASVGHDVIGYDPDVKVVAGLNSGLIPVYEPGLTDLISAGISDVHLSFTDNIEDALGDVEVLWVAYDTPVDDDDQAKVDYVVNHIVSVLPFLSDDAIVLVSSQLPVGSIRRLEIIAKNEYPNEEFYFAYSPENLRLGKALEAFLKPDRIVVGVRTALVRSKLEQLLLPITDRIEWMNVESAEMTKHAINAFLATSVVFANEIASICELTGADAKEVERGLKTEVRIGPKAYLSPGGPFAGGTLARDILFLEGLGQQYSLKIPLISSVKPSNDEHKKWVRRKLLQFYKDLRGTKVAIWGLTYKPGTDTLRRSLAVELCDWLIEQGVIVKVYDPVVKMLPQHWGGKVENAETALKAVEGADVLIVGTDWLELLLEAELLSTVANENLIVIDANRHLYPVLSKLGINYFAVGTAEGGMLDND